MRGALSFHASPALSLLEVPVPPPGYRLSRFLALSYSLDARVAIALLAAAFGRSTEVTEDAVALDLQSLNAFEVRGFVRRVLANSLFLVQHSADPIRGTASKDMLSLLQDRVFTVCVPSAPATSDRPLVNFHPKVILVEFARQERRWLRVYVGSRNLSIGTAREAAMVLDFDPDEHGQARLSGPPILRPLEALLVATKAKAFLGTSAVGNTKRHAEAIDEWRRTLRAMARARRAFIAPKGVTSAALLVQWPGSAPLAKALAKDLAQARSSVIVSPWLDVTGARFIDRLLPSKAAPCLWTLDSELAHLSPLQGRRATVVSESGDSLYQHGVEKEGAEIGFESRLHAKLSAMDFGTGGALWVGSANFTRPGLGLNGHPAANFEVMLRLACRRAGVTRWLAGLPTQSLKAALARGEVTAIDKEDEPNPLDWLRATWVDYPKRLRLELRKPASARGLAELYTQLKVIAFDVRGEPRTLGTASWQHLWKAGALELRTRLRDPKLQLDASLRIVPAGHRQAVFTHAPVPDNVALLRASKYLHARIGLDAALERLAQIQGGLGGRRRRGKNGSGGARNAASYAADLRLERIFLRLMDDDHDEIASDIDEIISCLKREGQIAGYAELASSLQLIVERAEKARARRI